MTFADQAEVAGVGDDGVVVLVGAVAEQDRGGVAIGWLRGDRAVDVGGVVGGGGSLACASKFGADGAGVGEGDRSCGRALKDFPGDI